MKKIFLGVFVTLYIIVSTLVTTCLLHFNDYRISEFGDKSIIIVNKNNKLDDFKNGSLLIVSKDLNDIKNGDKIFYYDTYENKASIKVDTVNNVEKITDSEKTFLLGNDKYLSSEYVIGKVNGTNIIMYLGYILNLLESKWGFLFIIILPILFLFVYEVYVLIGEVKPKKKKSGKKKNG